MDQTGRINVYIGRELRKAIKIAAAQSDQTIGEYVASIFEAILKVKGLPARQDDEKKAKR